MSSDPIGAAIEGVEETLAVAETREVEATRGLDDTSEADITLPGDSGSPRPPPRPRARATKGSSFARGDLVGRYVLVEELGAGGMGVVWAAYDPDLDRKVALKVLRQSAYGVLGTEGRSRLHREARALARLDHPNVVAVHDVGTHRGEVWIAMEFVDGQTLDAWFAGDDSQAGEGAGEGAGERAPRPWRAVVEVMLQAAEGLIAAHDKGLVHRDFKPANVMLGRDGRVRVMDFGLVHGGEAPTEDEDRGLAVAVVAPDAFGVDLTRAGARIGTPSHMAPEQHRGAATDARTDQFAFGITLWEGLYGERPFPGKTLAQLAYSVTEGQVRPPPEDIELPPWLPAIVRRCLAVDADARWPSMAEVRDAIVAELEREGDRPRTWRLLAGVAALGLLVGGAFAWQQVDRAQTLAACEATGQTLAAVWTEDARARAAARFAATELRFAPQAWDQTARVLDAWVGRWSTSRTQLCVETKLEDRWTETQAASARDCFAMREAEFSALLESYAEAEAEAVPRAVGIASRLGDPAHCLDERRLAQQLAPEDPELRAQVQALRIRGQRVAALTAATRHAEALAEAEAVLSEAETLDWPPIHAEAIYTLASVKNSMAEREAALGLHEQAFFMASEAGHDSLAARAATSLVGIRARKSDHEQALHWGRLGQVFLHRAGLDASVEEGMLLLNLGTVYMETEDSAQALAAFERTLELWEAALGPEHPDLGIVLTNLGTQQRRLDHYEEAEAAYRRAQDIFEHSYGSEHPMIGLGLVGIGTIHSHEGDYEGALEVQRQAEASLVGAYGPDDVRITSALNNQGAMLVRLGRHEQALDVHRRALSLRERANPKDPSVANSLANVAATLHALGRDAEALPSSERCLEIRLEVYGERHTKVASAHHLLAQILRGLGRLDEARAHAVTALELREELSGPTHETTGLSAYELGRIDAALGRYDDAMAELERALPLIVDEPQRFGARFELARVEHTLGREPDAAVVQAQVLRAELRALPDTEDREGLARERLEELDSWLDGLDGLDGQD